MTMSPKAVAALVTLVLAVTACGDDDSGDGSSQGLDVQALLGPVDQASGEPVRLGMVSDGATQAFDNTDELRAAEATAEYWNEHRGGVPAGATDCANRFVEEGVVAVALSQSGVAESVWEPLHAAGIPTMFFQAFGEGMLTDEQSTFVVVSPLSTLFGLPISVAETEAAEKIAFVIIDVPQAVSLLEDGAGPDILDRAGIDYDVVRIPPGTADMTSQMQDVAGSGAGVVHVIGNDAFCIAAFNGLRAVGYEGAITSISQCITDATREGVPGDTLDGMYLTATLALGATEDPTYELYQAVMSVYGDGVRDIVNNNAMGGYVAMAALATSLEGISGDVTPQTVVETIRAMPEQQLPGGGGVTFQCGRSAVAGQPAVCSTEWLRTELDADGQPTTYEVIDSTDLLSSP
jgi:branched-chain amino acid transport system substrate-binding protein